MSLSKHRDKLNDLAYDVSEGGMVVKAVLIVDYIDADGVRTLDYVPTEEITKWDFRGLLQGVLEVTQDIYKRRQ